MIVHRVDWGPIGAGTGHRGRLTWQSSPAAVEGTDRLYRLVLTCRSCRRRVLKRCHHEQFEARWLLGGGHWIRCSELVVGRDFCDAHRGGKAEGDRNAYDWTSMPDAGHRRCRHHATTDDYLPR
jgi:hypothetical protein